jgi:carboxyl-terminal processing protease
MFSIAKNLEIFSEMFRVLNEQYVDELNPNQVVRKGMDNMLDELDPYTNYFSEDMVEDIRTMRTGQYAGIGVTTRRFGNRTRITEISEGSPAARTSLRPGDEITGIDKIPLKSLTQEEADKLMRGQAGNTVQLQIRKSGSTATEELIIKREKIQLKTVSYAGMIDQKTGYLSLDEFGTESASEVKAAVLSLKEQGALSLIIDLRGNPGGLLDQAVNICSLFLPKGALVVTNRGKTEESVLEYHTRSSPIQQVKSWQEHFRIMTGLL